MSMPNSNDFLNEGIKKRVVARERLTYLFIKVTTIGIVIALFL